MICEWAPQTSDNNMYQSFGASRELPVVGRSTSQDSAVGSRDTISVLQDSQCSGFSQITTQDMFSQGSSDLRPESGQHTGGPLSMYEKWLNKRSSNKSDLPPHSSSDYKQKQLSLSNMHTSSVMQTPLSTGSNCHNLSRFSLGGSVQRMKAMEKDERDLIEQVSKTVQDCNAEMKSVLCVVKDKVENMAEVSSEQLRHIVASFLDDMWKQQENVLQAFQEQCKNKASITDLELQLSKKESQISMLEGQLAEFKKNDTLHIAKTVKREINSPLLRIQQKLDGILECTKDNKEQGYRLLEDCKHNTEAQWDRHCSLQKANQKSLAEIEKRIQAEIKKQITRMEFSQGESLTELREDNGKKLETCMANMQGSIKQQMEQNYNKIVSELQDGTLSQNINMIQDALKSECERMGKKLEDMFRKQGLRVQSSELENNVKTTLKQLENRFLDIQSYLERYVNSHRGEKHPLKGLDELESDVSKKSQNMEGDRSTTSRSVNANRVVAVPSFEHLPSSAHLNIRSYERASRFEYSMKRNAVSTATTSYSRQQNGTDVMGVQNHARSFQSTSVSDAFQNTTQNSLRDSATNLKTNSLTYSSFISSLKPHDMKSVVRNGPSPIAAVLPQRQQTPPNINWQPDAAQESLYVVSAEEKKLRRKQHDNHSRKKTAKDQQNTSRSIERNLSTILEPGSSQSWKENEPIGKCLRSRKVCFGNSGRQEKHSVGTGYGKLSKNDVEHSHNVNQFSVSENEMRYQNSLQQFGGSTLASFIGSRYEGKQSIEGDKITRTEDCGSACSSPSVSITKMNIKRQIRTPYRRPGGSRGTLPWARSHNRLKRAASPAPTLLSEISNTV